MTALMWPPGTSIRMWFSVLPVVQPANLVAEMAFEDRGPRTAAPGHEEPSTMQITRSSIDTQKGPADWFTGDVYIDAVAAPEATSTFAAASVHFTPGARTAWHTHPHGQTIFVIEGVGRCQREGGPVEEIRPGDRVFFEPGENHWHGAAPNRFMVHIAMQQIDENGSPVTWGEHVSDAQYDAAP
jgi:quercetin dioxygenase-like cupin family protein